MNAALLFFGLLWALMGKRRPSPSRVIVEPVEPEVFPAARGERTSSPPWPSVKPSGLPPFPGPGWEYDEPPPVAVQQRAAAIRAQLWSRGKGAHQIEQTGQRWIVYRAEITRGGKQGVVAYRERANRLPGERAQRFPTAPPPAAAAAPNIGPIVIPVATDTRAPNVYLMRPGNTYRFQSEVELPEGIDAAGIVRGMELGGAKNVKVSTAGGGSVLLLRYDITPTFDWPVVLGQWLVLPGEARIRIIEVKPIAVPMPTVSPLRMPTLRRGSSGDEVAVLQQKLGIPADGKFGSGTHKAVVEYQRQNGLAPDGIVGPQTWITMFGKAA